MKKETYILLKRDYLYKANKPDKEWDIRFNYNHTIISKPFENLMYPSIKRSYIFLTKDSTIFLHGTTPNKTQKNKYSKHRINVYLRASNNNTLQKWHKLLLYQKEQEIIHRKLW